MKVSHHLYDQLSRITSEENVMVDELIRNHTYTKLGGKADVYITPETYSEVQDIIKLANKEKVSFTMLGNGSNLIVKDGGIRGIVMNLQKLSSIWREEDKIVAQSGARIIDASRTALAESLAGLEFACGIPGSVGGALYMNAGAYGGEIKDVLESTIVVTKEGDIRTLTAAELDLDYRTSNIPDNGYIVLEATFALNKANSTDIREVMDDLTFKRESKQPLEYPSCGSVFKRPPGYFAGKLIQDSELQGTQIGGAEVSKKHAGFIVNKNNASATEYINLIRHVQKTVKEKFDVQLEREVRIIGEDPVE
ncbi:MULTISPECIES: UDP-N-acetylmuramate dehydrogenase [Oceanobacillus]|uniref:UDP-N-acetylenolpyruvoylglucosamine reductase n=1 Tax=Oceanobacillus kimchii TaxID=746691 RepID=A0ABQ5TK56_9BACI|nr:MULTISPECIES: UDP-N-acetylmuramate dehydrogenase [Oceanobacillus]MBT2652852.1 UDP-N-acetylmuramate dehydrogenase [Oceanobacillus sp. ISL-73]MCT1577396.1 UDP-N-acetylmuramate dehydrogenase [Oceanobacillus kimchii]MCT2137002.1 UDP-N-acetylmuramate dehydrogenase [Oceanobacillus kimchii]OEH53597.1 UDP-N-acetylenolpyruvoylglucosamine reductase [Oceanobacillus sp. E9]GLO64887.1 UDP-N-acetylenolpyruvoylglucosamine reductase 2 [Oceanobacillus kimchii]